MSAPLAHLGWDERLESAWQALGRVGAPGRVRRLDRGWSSVDVGSADLVRVRNLGADVAVGDWVVVDDDRERVRAVLPRRSAFIRRASFEGARAEAHVLAANIDVALLVHALPSPPNRRRLERELVLAFDSGADPVILLSKSDLVEDAADVAREAEDVALSVPVHAVSAVSGEGLDAIRSYTSGHRTVALLGASGVGKSTLVNALVGYEVQRVGEVRAADQRGRHTTVAAQLIDLPDGGYLVDTPGLRAVALWWEGDGIERAFADIFDLMDHCRFRDCKHESEPGCAVQEAIAAGTLDLRRLRSLTRLVAEQAAIEDEQKEKERAADRRGARRARR